MTSTKPRVHLSDYGRRIEAHDRPADQPAARNLGEAVRHEGVRGWHLTVGDQHRSVPTKAEARRTLRDLCAPLLTAADPAATTPAGDTASAPELTEAHRAILTRLALVGGSPLSSVDRDTRAWMLDAGYLARGTDPDATTTYYVLGPNVPADLDVPAIPGINAPGDATWPIMQVSDGPITYRRWPGEPVTTRRARVYRLGPDRITVILTERPEDPGLSITNGAQAIRTELGARWPGMWIDQIEQWTAIPGIDTEHFDVYRGHRANGTEEWWRIPTAEIEARYGTDVFDQQPPPVDGLASHTLAQLDELYQQWRTEHAERAASAPASA